MYFTPSHKLTQCDISKPRVDMKALGNKHSIDPQLGA